MKNSSVQENEFIYSSIYSSTDTEALRHYLDYFGISVNAFFYVCMDFHAGVGKRVVVSDKLRDIVSEIVPCISGLLKDKLFGKENLVLFVPVAKLGDDEDELAKKELVQNIFESVSDEIGLDIKLGVGKTCFDLSDTTNAYKSALNSLKNTSSIRKIVFPENFSIGSEVLIDKAKLFINTHLAENISLNDAADAVGVSVYYLSRIFKGFSGMSFVDYIAKQRVTRAKGLLKYSRLSISKISQECGFSDQNYFCKVFKKIVGVTPSQYRKTITDIM